MWHADPRRVWLWFLVSAAVLGLAALLWPARIPRSSGPFPQEAYLWQRVWHEPVLDAIASHGSNFTQITVLAAEAGWRQGQLQVVRVPLDVQALDRLDQPVGLALRIGPYPGPFDGGDETARALAALAGDLVQQAAASKLDVAELQIDFDCAETKLDGYKVWLDAIRAKVGSVPLTITALPSWLDRRAFRRLARATDGYVLQVHSLERPRFITTPFTLCDPTAARRAVEQAAQVGVPFRVALPTYGYMVAFDPQGNFIGLSAEGPSHLWPANAHRRRVQAQPAELAALVQTWTRTRPALMRGVIWYRLPVATDQLNWPWATLSKVMAGEIPAPDIRAQVRFAEPALVELDLVNEGSAEESGLQTLTVRWQDQRLVACDALLGFAALELESRGVQFSGTLDGNPLHPGERRMIGWARFNQPVLDAVQVTLEHAARKPSNPSKRSND